MDTNLNLLSRRQLRKLAATFAERSTFWAIIATDLRDGGSIIARDYAEAESIRSITKAAELEALANERGAFSHLPALLGLSKAPTCRA